MRFAIKVSGKHRGNAYRKVTSIKFSSCLNILSVGYSLCHSVGVVETQWYHGNVHSSWGSSISINTTCIQTRCQSRPLDIINSFETKTSCGHLSKCAQCFIQKKKLFQLFCVFRVGIAAAQKLARQYYVLCTTSLLERGNMYFRFSSRACWLPTDWRYCNKRTELMSILDVLPSQSKTRDSVQYLRFADGWLDFGRAFVGDSVHKGRFISASLRKVQKGKPILISRSSQSLQKKITISQSKSECTCFCTCWCFESSCSSTNGFVTDFRSCELQHVSKNAVSFII